MVVALIAGTMGSFANTSDIEVNADFGRCTVVVTQTNSDGEVTGTALHKVYNVNSQAECDKAATEIAMLYQLGNLQMK